MREWLGLRGFVCSLGAAGLLGGCAAKVVSVPGIGRVPLEEVCDDASCGTQGDDVRMVNSSGSAPLVAPDPSKFVGAKMNPDALREAPKLCGSRINPAQWGQTAKVGRTVGMSRDQGAKFKASLSAEIAHELQAVVDFTKPEKKASLTPTIDKVTREAISDNQSVEVATYTLTPQAHKAQVAACGGQSANARVVRSLTVVRTGVDASARIRDALEARISADPELKEALLSESAPTVRFLVDRIVGLKLANYTYVLAIGFDKV